VLDCAEKKTLRYRYLRRPENDPINLRLSQQCLETIELNHNNLSPSLLTIALVARYLIPVAGTALFDCLLPEHAGSPSYSEGAVATHCTVGRKTVLSEDKERFSPHRFSYVKLFDEVHNGKLNPKTTKHESSVARAKELARSKFTNGSSVPLDISLDPFSTHRDARTTTASRLYLLKRPQLRATDANSALSTNASTKAHRNHQGPRWSSL